MDLLTILLLPLGVFAFNPVLCGILAGAFSIPVFLPIYSTGSRLALAVAALVWWAFCWREATISPEAVRTDLALVGPLYLGAAIVGARNLVVGHRRPTTDAPGWRMSRQARRRR